jgi:hypothetical protein
MIASMNGLHAVENTRRKGVGERPSHAGASQPPKSRLVVAQS